MLCTYSRKMPCRVVIIDVPIHLQAKKKTTKQKGVPLIFGVVNRPAALRLVAPLPALHLMPGSAGAPLLMRQISFSHTPSHSPTLPVSPRAKLLARARAPPGSVLFVGFGSKMRQSRKDVISIQRCLDEMLKCC